MAFSLAKNRSVGCLFRGVTKLRKKILLAVETCTSASAAVRQGITDTRC